MFDVGWQELGLTAVVALLVLGPKEIPGLMRAAGSLARKARAVANEFRLSLEAISDEAELDDFKKIAAKKADEVEPLLSLSSEEAGQKESGGGNDKPSV